MPLRTRLPAALIALAVVSTLGGCGANDKPEPVSVTAPESGSCHNLSAKDLTADDNDTKAVDCTKAHTAETFFVGAFDPQAELNQAALAASVYPTCQKRWMDYVGADESLALRTVLSWVWFRPSKAAWDKGARWFRCDVVHQTSGTAPAGLPPTTKGVLLGKVDDQWLLCGTGASVNDSPKVPCDKPHDWRAVTTIVVAPPRAPYPGDRLVEVRSRDYCSDSVGAWMNYPIDYEYGYTWFHEAEWATGNRRSVCWARTNQ